MCSGTGLAMTMFSAGLSQMFFAVIVQITSSPWRHLAGGCETLRLLTLLVDVLLLYFRSGLELDAAFFLRGDAALRSRMCSRLAESRRSIVMSLR